MQDFRMYFMVLKTRLRTKLITVMFLMQICTRRILFPLAYPANVCLQRYFITAADGKFNIDESSCNMLFTSGTNCEETDSSC